MPEKSHDFSHHQARDIKNIDDLSAPKKGGVVLVQVFEGV
jgi:hypothetical protein